MNSSPAPLNDDGVSGKRRRVGSSKVLEIAGQQSAAAAQQAAAQLAIAAAAVLVAATVPKVAKAPRVSVAPTAASLILEANASKNSASKRPASKSNVDSLHSWLTHRFML